MAWEWDAPTGVYKNHALSSKLREEAIADVQFMRWLRPEPGYGKHKGESITITRILQLPLAGRVSEIDRLPSGRPALETKQVTPSEWGFKIEMTEFERNLSKFDPMNPYQKLLRSQMSLTMDVMGADAMKLTPYKYIPVTTGGVFDTDGTPSTTADKNLDVDDLRAIHDELRGTLKCPTMRGGKYIGILSTKAARGIKSDPEYKDWIAPTSASPLFTGMLKDIENFTLFETNHFDALPNAVGSNGILGEAIFFGDDAGFLAVIDEPEVRVGLPEDLGRFQEVGWVGTLEAGLTWEVAANARAIHVTSQ
jgi:N4-gp56 family major capsid protein